MRTSQLGQSSNLMHQRKSSVGRALNNQNKTLNSDLLEVSTERDLSKKSDNQGKTNLENK